MKRLFALFVLAAATVSAHPGVGNIIDSRGNIFYTDLNHVWRIAADGNRSIAVPNVHAHELCTDAKDNLYGEHLWYNGERLDTWGSRVWRRSADGRVVDIVPAHAGFNDYSFVRDATGNSYVAAHEQKEIRKRTPDGHTITIARGHFRDIRWMTVSPDGIVYFIDTADLIRVTPEGRVATVAKNLSDPSVFLPWVGSRHRLMGLWLDTKGNVYVADYGGRNVKRVDRAGGVSIVARSPYPWSPTGGVFDRAGNLWLLEYAPTNAARARRVPLTRPSATLSPLRGARAVERRPSPRTRGEGARRADEGFTAPPARTSGPASSGR